MRRTAALIRLLVLVLVLLCSSPAFSYEASFTIGYQAHVGQFDFTETEAVNVDDTDHGYHLSAGLRKTFGRHLFGFAIDVDEILGDTLIGYRALDYAYQLKPSVRIGTSFGVATLDRGLPQNGYYLTFNTTFLEALNSFDLTLAFRYGSGLARDRLLASDPRGTKPDIFLDYSSLAIGATKRF